MKLLDEVVVVTGGASGLGKCIAEIYSMKGVGVAVLDIEIGVKEEGEREGARYYRCDVGDRGSVEGAWRRVVEDVGYPVRWMCEVGRSNWLTMSIMSSWARQLYLSTMLPWSMANLSCL